MCGDCVAACYANAREIIGREVTVAEVMVEIEKDEMENFIREKIASN
jgi:ferredoxin